MPFGNAKNRIVYLTVYICRGILPMYNVWFFHYYYSYIIYLAFFLFTSYYTLFIIPRGVFVALLPSTATAVVAVAVSAAYRPRPP